MRDVLVYLATRVGLVLMLFGVMLGSGLMHAFKQRKWKLAIGLFILGGVTYFVAASIPLSADFYRVKHF